ncbi:CopG family transcriptional regulator [Nocardia carnea]|uniref:CopG family transcriptional regulator n=1 Tax=Nocardia carnea TaxID=37328 RepID=UPI002454A823|nr:CopG family transcriptional regulator [Nocardia carnea]
MALKKTTVMVDEKDLEIIKEAAARQGRPEAEYFREAFHIAALRARRWEDEWDIPVLDLGHPIAAVEVDEVVHEAITDADDRR